MADPTGSLLAPLRRLIVAGVVGLLIFQLGRWVTEATFLQQRFGDVLTRMRPDPDPHPNLVIIAADRSALDQHGSWPFAEDVLVSLVRELVDAGARGVVFIDPVLRGPVSDSSRALLREAVGQALIQVPQAVAVDPFADPRLTLAGGSAASDPLATERIGVAIVEPNADGVVRTAAMRLTVANPPALVAEQGAESDHPALALAVARQLRSEEVLTRSIDLPIRFTGPARSRASVSMTQVLAGDVAEGVLSGKICLVGLYDPARIGTLTTPLSDAPLYVAPVEVHAAVLDTLLGDRFGLQLPAWVYALMAAIIAIWLVVGVGALRPLWLLGLTACYICAVPVVALALDVLLYIQIPVLSYVITGVAILLAQLIVQLVRYQDDLLSLLTVLQRTHWLLPEDQKQRLPAPTALTALARRIDYQLDGSGTIVARAGHRSDAPLRVVCSGGFAEGETLVPDTELGAIPVQEMAVVDGDLLADHLHGRFWAVPIGQPGAVAGWLLVRMEDMRQLRRNEPVVQALVRPLAALVHRETEAGHWLPDLGVFRLLRSRYLSDITGRLETLQQRDRREREIITLMLDTTQVGLVLADGMGRILFRNRFIDEVLVDVGLVWDGESAVELIELIADRQVGTQQTSDLRNCFRVGEGQGFTIASGKDNADSYLLHVAPLMRDAAGEVVGAGDRPGSGVTDVQQAPWPDHIIMTVANITALRQVDKLKSELIEMISFKCRSHMASILVCSDLLSQQPEMAEQVVPELQQTAQALDQIFEQYRNTADFGIDHAELEKPVPLNLDRIVREVLVAVQDLVERQGVVVEVDKGRMLESALVAEAPLRQALDDLFRACLHASRPQQTIAVSMAEGQGLLVLEVLLPECTLAVALKRFPINDLADMDLTPGWLEQARDEGDLSPQAAAMMPDVYHNLHRIGCQFRARSFDETGLVFRIAVPQLG